MACDARHPKYLVECFLNDESHEEHFSEINGGKIRWANDDYIPPADLKKIQREQQAKQQAEEAIDSDYVTLHSDPHDTEAEAALSIITETGASRRRQFELIASAWPGGCTDDESQRQLRMNPSTQRPRRRELVLAGLVEDSGQKRLIATTGKRAKVWRLTEVGHKESRK